MNDSGVIDIIRMGTVMAGCDVITWLGKRKRKIVIYVAFGSELNLSQNELTELALGLELSGLPFFWALRNRDETIVLPDGFEERVKGRGVVSTSWAPQLRILAHESVGAFLTHWLIARVFVEKKAGIEIVRNGARILRVNSRNGTISLPPRPVKFNAFFHCLCIKLQIASFHLIQAYTRKSVAEVLKLVIVEEEGRIYREKAKELGVLFADEKFHDQYVHKFAEFLQNHRQVSDQ
ncbi:hypothetical protein Pint_04919 [Pistacia integerrima]|uniref:Uncharacterized protein n=1 Tax=Pistacia integerrima TaxID=434235 RepID=A0ACC0Z7D9_9ROSI|nr:hypothetical protein Pint_04919 [Pistacia integerrima]